MATNAPIAPVTIVSGPGHMMGRRKQIEEALQGKNQFPDWYKTWAELRPNDHLDVLESPAQVARFFRQAARNPDIPRVGFIANTYLSLHCGVSAGVIDHTTSRFASRHAYRYAQQLEWETMELRLLRNEARKEDTGTGDEGRDWTAPLGAGESARTRARDRVFRVGAKHPLLRDGLACPDCGRVQRLSDGKPIKLSVLRSRGFARIKCGYCGNNIGQHARVQDSASDRSEMAFQRRYEKPRTTIVKPVRVGQQVVSTVQPLFTSNGLPMLSAAGGEARPLFDSQGMPVLDADANHPDAQPLFDVLGAPVMQDGAQAYGVQRRGVQVHTVAERTIPLVEWETVSGPTIPWGKVPTSNPRYALAKFIQQRYAGLIDVYIADEVQDYKGGDTAIGRAFGSMNVAAHRTIALTGTESDGKASNVYWLLLRLGNNAIEQEYGWDGESRFVKENGVVADVIRDVQRRNDAGVFSGERSTSTGTEELPGATAPMGALLQNHSIQVLLRHMGFKLPTWSEDATIVPLPADIAEYYKELENEGGALARKYPSVLGSYLQTTLSYPYQPWNPCLTIGTPKSGYVSNPTDDPKRILPHHETLAAFAASRVDAGRRVLVYAEHTMNNDILQDVAAKITDLAAQQHGVTLKVAILRSTTVKPGERAAWFSKMEADGYNVVLCNPRLVKTGLNLVGWPSIFVLEPCYSLYVVAQAIKRAYRATQTEACEVHYFAYARTMSARALSIMAEKLAALAILRGDSVGTGIASAGRGASLMQELAQIVMAGEASDMNVDVAAALRANAQAFSDLMNAGASDLIGVAANADQQDADARHGVPWVYDEIVDDDGLVWEVEHVPPTEEPDPAVVSEPADQPQVNPLVLFGMGLQVADKPRRKSRSAPAGAGQQLALF